jgi:rRNA-processing protein FCF1
LLSPVVAELEKLRDSGSLKMQKKASQALKLTEKCVLVKIDKQNIGSPDDIIVQIASQWQCPVLTNDSQLRKRLRDINVPVVYVRQKSRLEIDGKI